MIQIINVLHSGNQITSHPDIEDALETIVQRVYSQNIADADAIMEVKDMIATGDVDAAEDRLRWMIEESASDMYAKTYSFEIKTTKLHLSPKYHVIEIKQGVFFDVISTHDNVEDASDQRAFLHEMDAMSSHFVIKNTYDDITDV